MSDAPPDEDGPSLGGCAFAVAVGPAVVAGVTLAFAALTGRRPDLAAEGGVFLIQALMVAAPFLLLSLKGTRDRLPWLVALGLTLAAWGYYLFEGVRYQWSGDRSGVDMGVALGMLVSPLLIAGAAYGIYALRRKG
jgi:hypothetical protein